MDHLLARSALDLARLQREFQDYVLQRDPAVLQHVLGTGTADAVTRMDVYADGERLTSTPVTFALARDKLRIVVP